MIEGYCVKCKAKRPISDAVEELMKNGRKAVKGKCPTCGAVMFKILGGKSAAQSSGGSSGSPSATSGSEEDSGASTSTSAAATVATNVLSKSPEPAPAPEPTGQP